MGTAVADASAPLQEQGYTIGQAVDLTGLSEHTLRYYERARLLAPVRRHRSSRHRRYSAEDLARLQPLQRELLSTLRRVIEAKLDELRGHLDYLDRKIAYWRAVELGDEPGAAAIARDIVGSFECATTTVENR